MVGEFHNGLWLVDLAPLSDPSLIWHALASVLGMSEEPSRQLADAVVDYFRSVIRQVIVGDQ
jgi:predicted ATPase